LIVTKLLPCALVFSGLVLGQGTINTYAGNDALFQGSGQPAISAQLVGPTNSVVDAQGNVYISAGGLSMVLKVTSATGVITVFAGNGLSRFAGDGGLAVGASLANPQGLAFDSAGNLFIVDAGNNRIRKVTPAGIITTVAGGGNGGDGSLATQAGLSGPAGVVLDKSGNLYMVDYGDNRVRMVSASTGIISTIAGTGALGFSGDGGPAINATFVNPNSIAIDASGNLYIGDTYSGRIRKFFPGGIITTVAGGGSSLGDNGPATQAQLNVPLGVAVDASGNLYIADSLNERVRRVGVNGIITTIAGTGQAGFSGDGGPATAALFSNPVGVALDASGNVYVADLDNNRIRRVVQGGPVTTIAGTTTSVGDGGPSTQARLVYPRGAAVDSSGNLYIADSLANRVRKVTPSGIITTLAGTGQTGSGGDNGPGALAVLNNPTAVAVDPGGNVYIGDSNNNVIRRVNTSTGIITLFAGNYNCCYSGTGTGGDGGPATAATLWGVGGIAVDGAGNVYIATGVANGGTSGLLTGPNGGGEAVRRITTDGIIHPWAGGTQAGPGFSGDGGPPLQAVFSGPMNIAVGSDGSLYIADGGNNRVRKVDPAGATINTVAGSGQYGSVGDGVAATSAPIDSPTSVALDAAGNLYIGNNYGSVWKVTSGGIIGPYAGIGQPGFSGDGGPATAASIGLASGLAVDSGNKHRGC
jgi:trimeric autotransporter adhesin